MKFLKQLLHSFLATTALVVIVFLLVLFGAIPYVPEIFGSFLIGAGLLVIGQAIFLTSVDGSIIRIGKEIGTALMKGKKLLYIILFGFLFGFVTTIAEPDVQVLVGQLTSINSFVSSFLLISILGIGAGLLVAFAVFRILKGIPLKWILLGLYTLIIVLSLFCPSEYFGLAFDAGGTSTGAITGPFLLMLVIGICAIRGKNSKNDSFGAVAITSTGPIIALLVLGIICGAPTSSFNEVVESASFLQTFLAQGKNVLLAISPLFLIFVLSQIWFVKLPFRQVVRICVSFAIATLGLILFLTGIYFGFSDMGNFIGETVLGTTSVWFIVAFGMLFGFVLVFTDPATIVLVNEIESVTAGFLKKHIVFITLGVGVALAVCLAFIHVIFSINLIYLLLPLYAVRLALNFFIPKIFAGIAFDSGGIASGTMVVAFILPICIGMSTFLGNDVLMYGFGVAGLVATLPILTIQVLGLLYKINKTIHNKKTGGTENE